MSRLRLDLSRRPEYAASPEFQDLLTRLVAAARAVFDEVSAPEEPDFAPPHDRDFVLSLPDDVLLLPPTLAAMKAAVEEGAAFAAPHLLAALAPRLAEPVHTLRGFEEVEGRLLNGTLEAPPEEEPIVTLRYRGRPGGSGVRVGLCHRFADYYREPRVDVLELIPEGTHEVLEVGCGAGVTGELLERRLGCRVTGVELNPVAAREAATRISRVIPGDVLAVTVDERFDLVLALELFEHLVDPAAFLERATGWLRPAGTLLLSVPNVAHWSIVEDLLAGRFDYLPIGLTCFTHYRFYTRASLTERLHRSGFTRLDVRPQSAPLPQRVEEWVERSGVAADRESLATHGFFVLARR